jgi:hypothetical protein
VRRPNGQTNAERTAAVTAGIFVSIQDEKKKTIPTKGKYDDENFDLARIPWFGACQRSELDCRSTQTFGC